MKQRTKRKLSLMLLIFVILLIIAALVGFSFKAKEDKKRAYTTPKVQDSPVANQVEPYTPSFPKELMLIEPHGHTVSTSQEGDRTITKVDFTTTETSDILEVGYLSSLKYN